MPQFSVLESNSNPTTQVTGTVGGAGFTLLGIARAGSSSIGVGQVIQGTYGTLVMNSNGSFTYQLNNADPDTNLLGAGMSALERFTYTYSLNGSPQTAAISFQVNGVDEVGQIISTPSNWYVINDSAVIGPLERIDCTVTEYGLMIDGDPGEVLNVTNNGVIRASSPTYQTIAVAIWDHEPASISFTNNGLIEVTNDRQEALAGYVTSNNGVIRLIATGTASAIGSGLEINTGTIEVTSQHGNAIGVRSAIVNNSGFIYASGGDSAGGLVYAAGIESGATGVYVQNSGTIQAISNSAAPSIGINLWPNGSNVHSYGTVINSGTIVADIAVYAVDGYATGIHVTNSGRIEGDLLFTKNTNIVQNESGGVWVGDLNFGFDQDVFRNSGTVTGNISLNAGDDLFDGRGGTISGIVDGGSGNDLMRGGSAADQLNGGAGDDRIYGGGGADILSGGEGADVFVYSAQAESTTAVKDTINAFQSGIDKIDLSQLAPSSISITTSGGYSFVNVTVTGGTLSIRVQGSISSSDIVTNAALGDQFGTSGDDLLEAINGNASLYGGGGNDVMHGNAGDNYFDGSDGNDTMYGGAGNDTYLVTNDGDRIIELAGQGTDNILTWVDYSLQAFVENATILGSENIGILGNDLANQLIGNNGVNVLRGLGGDDIIIGGFAGDALEGGAGFDRFVYQAESDSVFGAADHIVAFEHGVDIIDLTAVAPIAYQFVDAPNHGFGSWPWAGVFIGFTQVMVTTATGGTMMIWVSDKATLADFSVNALLNGTEINDTLIGSVEANQINGQGGNDTLNGLAGNDTLIGGAGDDMLLGGAGTDTLTGGSGTDTFQDTKAGLSGDTITDLQVGDKIIITDAALAGFTFSITGDTLTYTGGSLTLQGPLNGQLVASAAAGGGVQLIMTSAITEGDDTIIGTDQADVIDSLGGNDTIYALGGNDQLYGNSGDDTLDGGAGDDALDGGIGFDTASYASAGSAVFVNLTIAGAQSTGGAGNDTLVNIENLTGSAYNDALTGNGEANVLLGLAGIDILDGGAGDDVLDGGSGIDEASYASATSGVTVSLALAGSAQNTGAAGSDTLFNIENLLGSNHNDVLTGDEGANYLFGGFGNDSLYGAGGDDRLEGGRLSDDLVDGGAGNDTALFLTSLEDLSVSLLIAGPQNTGNGMDTLVSIENIEGGVGNDQLTGNAGDNSLRGNGGNDTLIGGGGSDLLTGDSGNDVLLGGDGFDWLAGGSGNDVLDGGAGSDAMGGGLGDDKYYVDSAGDQLLEAAGEGDDSLFVLGTYTLAQGVSIETLVALNQSSTDPLILTGNEYGQSLYGNLGDNYLNGGQGNDYLVGLAGNDNLLGGTGADNMAGGTGNDVYYADQAGDQIFENVGEGNDIVVATASWTLNDGAEVETMSADPNAGNINLTGNEFGQSMYGNAGNNNLTGGGGSDYMVGGLGNDVYYVDTSDFIGEDVGGGDDTIVVATSYTLREGNEIEALVALNQASTAPVDFTGNEFGQSLYGSEGVNHLDGGAGNDFLVGQGGNDFLVGGLGNDNLDGGQGNDIYYVDGFDQVFEAAGQGDDLVVAFQSFILGASQSIETLSAADGVRAVALTGNELAQSIYGNAAANWLDGRGGADYMVGGGGDDTFFVTVMPAGPNVATFADYTLGDKVALYAVLSVASGTDVVADGYVRVTASGQLQIDQNGGGDNFVTIANVSGSAPVTIQYISGPNPTEVTIARSASQEADAKGTTSTIAMAVAAAGLIAEPLAAREPADAAASTLVRTSEAATQHQVLRTLASHDEADGRAVHDQQQAIAAPAEAQPHAAAKPVLLVQAHLDTAHEAAPVHPAAPADIAAEDVGPALIAAPSVMLPAAAQLAALAADHGSTEFGLQVGRVLAEALHDAGSIDLDPLLAALPGNHGPALAEFASLADGGTAMAPLAMHDSLFATMALHALAHPDAVAFG